MPEDSFTYETAIKDGMTEPAHNEAAAIDKLTESVTRNDAALKHHAESSEHAGKGAEHAEGFLKEFSGALVPQIALGELAAESIKKIGESAYELGEKLVEAGVELVHFSLETSEFKENLVDTFTVIEGSAEGGEEAFAALQRTAVAAHLSINEAGDLAKRLAVSGVQNAEALDAAVAAIGALKRTGLDEGSAKLERIIEQSEALGHFQLPKKLGGLGTSVDAIVNELSKSLGRTPDMIKQQLKAGQISAEQGIAAITNTINQGQVGAIAARKFDLSDVATDWHNVWVKLTEDVDASPLVYALRDFVSIFDDGTASGKTFKDTIVDGVNSIIKTLASGVESATIFGLETEVAFLTVELAAKPMVDALRHLEERQHILRILGDMAQKFGSEMMTAADEVLRLADAWNKLTGRGDGLALEPHGKKSGNSLADGLATGIQEREASVRAAASQSGAAAVDAMRKALDAHSPSRVTMALGADVVEGMVIGVSSNAPKAQGAMREAMGTIPSFDPGSMLMGGGGGRTVTIGSVIENLTVHGGGEGVVDEIGSIVEEKLADAIERINLELGG